MKFFSKFEAASTSTTFQKFVIFFFLFQILSVKAIKYNIFTQLCALFWHFCGSRQLKLKKYSTSNTESI